jgi:hypothetical protein
MEILVVNWNLAKTEIFVFHSDTKHCTEPYNKGDQVEDEKYHGYLTYNVPPGRLSVPRQGKLVVYVPKVNYLMYIHRNYGSVQCFVSEWKTNISVFVKVQFTTSISITIMLEPELFGYWLLLLPEQYTVKPVYKGHSTEPENVAFIIWQCSKTCLKGHLYLANHCL